MAPSAYGGAVRDRVMPANCGVGRTGIWVSGEHDLSTVVASSQTIARRVLDVCGLNDLIETGSKGRASTVGERATGRAGP